MSAWNVPIIDQKTQRCIIEIEKSSKDEHIIILKLDETRDSITHSFVAQYCSESVKTISWGTLINFTTLL